MKDGKIYTPENIVDLMISDLDISQMSVLEPSCGDGNFVCKLLNAKSLKVQDIDQEALNRLKERTGITGINENFLLSDVNEKFDLIIGNPPYIKLQDLTEDDRKILKNFETCAGSCDIYYAFIEQSLKKLKKNGILRFIIPNSWLINSSAKKLRNLLSKYDIEVFDFKDEKVFKNIGTYTCILTVRNSKGRIKVSSKNNSFYLNDKEDLWAQKPDLKFNFKFENGLATLCDKAFVFEKKEGNKYFSKVNNSFIEIEDEYIKPIIKGSTLEEYWCLYPYDNNGCKKKPNGKAMEYLLSIKEILENRDYDDEWWNFGRRQGIKNMSGKKIVMSTIVSPNKEIKYKITDDLVYSGIFVKNNFDEVLKFINSNEIKEYILNYGKKMSGGYSAFSKALLKNIVE